MKYNQDIVDRICSMIRENSYTIHEICQQVGISEQTYHKWKSKKPEFLDSIKEAENELLSMIASEAKRSLVKKIKGYNIEETKTTLIDTGDIDENGERIYRIKDKVISVKHIPPSDAIVIFTLSSRDSENWKNKQYTENPGEIKRSSQFENMTDEQLEEFINES